MSAAEPARSRSVASAPSRAEERRQSALAAARYLAAEDARLAALIDHIGPHRPKLTADPFAALVGAVLQQQVSMSAAAAIHRRLKALCPRDRITPPAILTCSPNQLRTAGLSWRKVEYVRGLAEAFAAKTLTPRMLRRMSDEQVLAATTQLRGIGRWTAEMLLIFCLERPDVWPIDDLGLRKAAQRFLQLDDVPDAKTLNDLAAPWRPYRSYATWYLWRSLEGPLMPGIAL